MKKLITLVILFMQLILNGQTPNSGLDFYNEGMSYLNGVQKEFDPNKGKKKLIQAANLGYSKAMSSIGDIYLAGLGTKKNLDSALFWYRKSIDHGNISVYNTIGNIYKNGILTQQNFERAVYFFQKGANLNENECIFMLAYMNYKGLGTKQNYSVAFNLFNRLVNIGDTKSMYFLGLCLKNGYGTDVDVEGANYWLLKASKAGDHQSRKELAEPQPENISSVSDILQQQLTQIKSSNEKFTASSSNNYQGKYSGYVVYYDWSGKFVHEIIPLALDIKKSGSGYEGTWKEGNNSSTTIKIYPGENQFKFDKSSLLVKNNHYSGRYPEIWKFNNAYLNMSFYNDSIQLSGSVNFYSVKRKEPGKPVQIFLKKGIEYKVGTIDDIPITLFPNPAISQTSIQFEIKKSARVGFTVSSLDGNIVYKERDKLLQFGVYNYNLSLKNLIPGAYHVQLFVDGKPNGNKRLIKL